MSWTTPVGVNTGAIITQTYTETIIRDNLLYLYDRVNNPPRAFAYNNTTQSIANTTDTAVALNAEFVDSATLHDNATNNSRITIPAGEGGWWLFVGKIEFVTNATGQRKLMLRLGGATEMAAVQLDTAAGGNATKLTIAFMWNAAAAEYYELVVSQNSGGALNLAANSYFLAQRIA